MPALLVYHSKIGMVLCLLIGLAIGSFVSAFTYRLPGSVSWVGGRSFCDRCRKTISWFDNIPLVSYLVLLGRCRNCKKKISLRYPAIELAGGLFFVGLWCIRGNYFSRSPIELLFILFLFVITLSIFIIDLEHQFIPDGLIFTGIVISVLYFLLVPGAYPLMPGLFAGFVSAFFLLVLHLITKGKGMGLGDVKLAILGGLILGWPYFVVWLFLSFISGAFIGIVLILLKKAHFGKKIPFGPYLVVSFWVTFIWGNWLLAFLM